MRSKLLFLAYAIVVLCWSYFVSRRSVAGIESARVEIFSAVFIPLLTLTVHLWIVRLLPLKLYAVLLILDLLFTVGVTIYQDYFGQNIDFHILNSNFREAFQIFPYVLDLIPKWFFMAGIVAISIEYVLARRIKPLIRPRNILYLTFVIFTMMTFAMFHVPLHKATVAADSTLAIKIYGHYLALLSDFIFTGTSPSEDDLIRSLKELQKFYPPVDPAIRIEQPSGNLMAIQVESLDYNILGYRFREKEVVPFLNRISRQSVVFKLNAFHYGASGSSGADFQFLTGLLPLTDYPVYKVQSLNYENSLPKILSEKRIHSYAFHGNAASMWSRAYAFRKMGFTYFYDLKDFQTADEKWGVNDQSFFQQSRESIEKLGDGNFYFLITLSSHGPFRWVENDFCTDSDLVCRYFNSIHFVDKALQNFLQDLKGRYLVILYGDHSAAVKNDSYQSREDGEEYVPALLFILENGSFRKPVVSGNSRNLLSGVLDIRSLHILLQSWVPR